MTEYKIVWEIDIEADSPEEAAEIARGYQVDPDSFAVVFDVYDAEGRPTRVDLYDYEEANH